MIDYNKLVESDNLYLNELKKVVHKNKKSVLQESTQYNQKLVQIISIRGNIYWLPFPDSSTSDPKNTYKIENYDSIKKVGGESITYSFEKWRELPSIKKAIKQGIADLIDQGKCDMEMKNIWTRYALFKNFKGFKHFPSNAVVEFKLTTISKIRHNVLPPWYVFSKYKGKVQRLR